MRIKQILQMTLFFGFVVSIVTACGNGDQTESTQAMESGTGAISFHLVMEPPPHQATKNFTNCSEINSVAAMVLDDSNVTIAEDNWVCDEHIGTITNVTPGKWRLVTLGYFDDDHGRRTHFYESAPISVWVHAGETTHVGDIPLQYTLNAPRQKGDWDGDGYFPDPALERYDCDDTDPGIYTGAEETCNGKDDDCDGWIDEGVQKTFFKDDDKDGFGTRDNTMLACSAPDGYVEDSSDCNDANSAINPGAEEINCDGLDNDCNGVPDCDWPEETTYYLDADNDGFGDQAHPLSVTGPPYPDLTGYVDNDDDCDDNAAAVNPKATETCNGIDDDCDGSVDEELLHVYYFDEDGDGFGTARQTCMACSVPEDYVANDRDCNDEDPNINPGMQEQCNLIDDNCHGGIDEGLAQFTYYADTDGDGYGDATNTTAICGDTVPAGYVSDSTDCDDGDAGIHPGATEIFHDGIDQDCSGADMAFYLPRIAAGDDHTVGLQSNGTVVAVGGDLMGQLDVDEWADIVQVAAGSDHTVGLQSDGTVEAVGWNVYGQINIHGWEDIVQVAAGGYHTVGLQSDGAVVAVGNNDDGQTDVADWKDIVQVAANGCHTVGLQSDGTVVAVGCNDSGQTDVSAWKDIVQVAAGGFHTVGLQSDGTVVAVGWSSYGELDVSTWKDIVQVAAGACYAHLTVGLKSDGTVVAVGWNENGQLGVSAWKDIVQVAAGGGHTVGLKSDGTVVAVGLNDSGQIGVSTWALDVNMATRDVYPIGLGTITFANGWVVNQWHSVKAFLE